MSQELEIIEERPLVDASVIEAVTRSEIDQLIGTARKYPRSIKQAADRMVSLASMDEESAAECIYSLPRAKKPIEGPSIRFAELCSQSFGNCRVASRVTMVDRIEKFVEAEGFFLDAETNVATLARVRRRISGKDGRVYNDDMIVMTSNAAQSIARRNAILAGIPKAVWRRAYAEARMVVMGDHATLSTRRDGALKAFGRFGLTESQVLDVMGLKGVDDIDLERLVPLRGLYASLLNNDVTVEELLREITPERAPRVTAATAKHAAPAVFDDADLPSVDAAAAPAAKAEAKPDEQPEVKPKPRGKKAEADDKPTAASALVSRMRIRRV